MGKTKSLKKITLDDKLQFTIRKIKVVSFFIDEAAFKNQINDFTINYNSKFGFNLAHEFVEFTLKVSFFYPNELASAIISIDVQTIFEVENLKKFDDGSNNLNLPLSFTTLMVQLSTSHTRALLGDLTSRSIYNNVILPESNPEEMAKAFF